MRSSTAAAVRRSVRETFRLSSRRHARGTAIHPFRWIFFPDFPRTIDDHERGFCRYDPLFTRVHANKVKLENRQLLNKVQGLLHQRYSRLIVESSNQIHVENSSEFSNPTARSASSDI